MGLSETVLTLPDSAARRAFKAAAVRDAVLMLPSTAVVGDLTLVFDAPPALVRGKTGEVIGVDATIRAFRAGRELVIDPHRICVNPPLQRADGTFSDVEVTSPFTGKLTVVRRANTVEDPAGAYLDWLVDSIRTNPNPAGFRTKGTVTTVYAQAADDWIQSLSFVSWAAAQAGGEADFNVQGSSPLVAYVTGDSAWVVCQSYLSFDTSGIPDTDTVSAFVLSLAGNGDAEVDTIAGATIQAREHNWGASVTTADWIDGSTAANWTGKTLIADFDPTSWAETDGTYNDFTQQGAVSVINKTGTTYMVIGPSGISGSDPGAFGTGVSFWGEAPAGTTKDAKLTITHAASGPTRGRPFGQRGNAFNGGRTFFGIIDG